MSASLHVPLFIKADSEEALSNSILELQNKVGGKISIITILVKDGKYVCWYYPPRNLGGGLM